MTNEQYLLMAYNAAKASPDPSTQNGAVIVSNGVSVSACNTFPKMVKSTPERLERPLKYHYVEHAERGVIYEAAKLGISTQGATMYVPWYACADCARAIICSGISRVIGHQKMLDGTPERWRESINEAFNMLKEAGVKMEWIQGDLNGPKILFNGEWFYP